MSQQSYYYFDHAAQTPIYPEVAAALPGYFSEVGNAAAIHNLGGKAKNYLETARETIADLFGINPREIIFTSGGTESNNLAIRGIFQARKLFDSNKKRIIVSAIEHHSVLEVVFDLANSQGATVDLLYPDKQGYILLPQLETAVLRNPDDVALVAVMWANNEIGTIQPIAELAEICASYQIPFFSDAIAAVGHTSIDFNLTGVSALSFAGHKFGGPLGVGGLFLRQGIECVPQLLGGGQEQKKRAGSVAVPLVRALALALTINETRREVEQSRIKTLSDRLIAGVLHSIPNVVFNGSRNARLVNNINFSFPGCSGDDLLLLLDNKNICVATGSACTAGVTAPSHVLLALGMPKDLTLSTLRFTLGWTNSVADIDYLLKSLPDVVAVANKINQIDK